MINNHLLALSARGANPRIADAMFRGQQQGNALRKFQQEQEDRNALAQIANVYASQGPQAAVRAAGQAGQFDAVRQIDNTVYGRGRDASQDAFRNKQFTYRQGRDREADAFRNKQFNAQQDYRGQQIALGRERLTAAKQKAAAKKTGAGKPTVDSAKAAGFFERMSASDEILNRPESIEAATSLGQKMIGGVPVAGNFFVTPEFRSYDQAKRDFINAQLRRESGAVISDAEFANAERQYFPQPGDDPAVIAQKAQNRRIAIESNRKAGLPSLSQDTGNPGTSTRQGMSS